MVSQIDRNIGDTKARYCRNVRTLIYQINCQSYRTDSHLRFRRLFFQGSFFKGSPDTTYVHTHIYMCVYAVKYICLPFYDTITRA